MAWVAPVVRAALALPEEPEPQRDWAAPALEESQAARVELGWAAPVLAKPWAAPVELV